jgi:hypothetical protein
VRESRGTGAVRKRAAGGGERIRDGADMWATATWPPISKTTFKTAGGPKVNGFKSSMAKDFWFCGLMSKIKLGL